MAAHGRKKLFSRDCMSILVFFVFFTLFEILHRYVQCHKLPYLFQYRSSSSSVNVLQKNSGWLESLPEHSPCFAFFLSTAKPKKLGLTYMQINMVCKQWKLCCRSLFVWLWKLSSNMCVCVVKGSIGTHAIHSACTSPRTLRFIILKMFFFQIQCWNKFNSFRKPFPWWASGIKAKSSECWRGC